MADIRMVQPRTGRMWFWALALALLGILLWASKFVVGDATDPERVRGVGANAGFGDERAPLIPMVAEPFEEINPIETRDLGRLVRITGVIENGVRANSAWVQAADGRRILVRFEPSPPEGALARLGPGSRIDLPGYISKVSRAEFNVWIDTLGASIPRPRPGRKFGDLPDPAFMRLDSLFVKTFYISVRPEALEPEDEEAAE
ncbi:MAG TPA: hypothetical protein VF167_05495 [Longimicrobiaceae bacterium]